MSQPDPANISAANPAPRAAVKVGPPGGGRIARLRRHLSNIYRLMIKELRSFRADPVMMALVAYAFTVAIYAVATGASTEATNLSVGIVDEDHSDLSRRIADGLTPPTFKPAIQLATTQIDAAMNSQQVIFVIEIPPRFEADLLAGRQPSIQIDVDATAAAQAFNGMTYIQNVIINYTTQFLTGREGGIDVLSRMVTQVKFNPNLKPSWFTSVMQIISNLTMITVLLSGAALEQAFRSSAQQGQRDKMQALVYTLLGVADAGEILANGVVIVLSAGLSLLVVVQWWLQVPINGSILLFLAGACLYVFTVAALGIALGTIASTMAQFGLLSIPVLLVMMLLSGGTTPLESMPVWLQYVMETISPTPHFVIFAQGVLYRGADAAIVWPEIVATVVIGSVFFGAALYRFRRVIFGG